MKRALRELVLLGTIALAVSRVLAPATPPPPRLTLAELIAVRRLAAHDAAVHRNRMAAAACEVARDLRPWSFRDLFGERPGTMGPLFDTSEVAYRVRDLAFATRRRGDDLVDASVTLSEPPRACSPSEDPEVFCPFQCTWEPRRDCEALARQLSALGGDGRDPTQRVRAVVVLDGACQLRFQRYVEAARWIAWTTTAEVPLALIGEPASRLPAYRDDADRWPLLVTGETMLDAEIDVHTARGRIVGFTVSGHMEPSGGADELHALVRRFHGGRLPVTLWTRDDAFELQVGVQPARDATRPGAPASGPA